MHHICDIDQDHILDLRHSTDSYSEDRLLCRHSPEIDVDNPWDSGRISHRKFLFAYSDNQDWMLYTVLRVGKVDRQVSMCCPTSVCG